MNKFDEKLAQYVEDAKKIGISIDEDLNYLYSGNPTKIGNQRARTIYLQQRCFYRSWY